MEQYKNNTYEISKRTNDMLDLLRELMTWQQKAIALLEEETDDEQNVLLTTGDLVNELQAAISGNIKTTLSETDGKSI